MILSKKNFYVYRLLATFIENENNHFFHFQ
jgi:hypothetical protein